MTYSYPLLDPESPQYNTPKSYLENPDPVFH